MRKPLEDDFSGRRDAAAKAKAAQLEAHRAAVAAAEPSRLERQEERREIAAARDVRHAERDQAKQEDRDRILATAVKLQEATDAATQSRAEASEKALNDRVSRVIEDEAARKAERDRRYASRKAKK